MGKQIKLFLDGKKIPYYNASTSLKDILVVEAIDKSLRSSCKTRIR